MEKQVVLQKYFGYDAFRPGQQSLIEGILSGRDVFGIMPTGGGKSICYQLPALLLPGITLVVSPLISLMQDQVQALITAGIPAAYINSSLSASQMQAVYRNLLAGKYKLVYIAPERLDYSGFVGIASKLQISLLAVDEAHCISQWGQDFRPSYLRIVQFIRALPVRPVVGAFTATATEKVREDVERILMLQEPVRIITGFDRPNLSFEVIQPKKKDEQLQRLLIGRRDKSGIVYCATRKAVEQVCLSLQEQGYHATRYHAGLPEHERFENQEDFIHDRKRIMVATNAFGMGIDKSNVSFVIHYNMPKSMEAYYQEAGRAGRDGAPAECILLYNAADVRTAQFLIENSADNEELDSRQRAQVRAQDMERLERMTAYCKTTDCLRGFILEYFGQKHGEVCGNCSNCKGEFEEIDITRESQMLLSCVKRVEDKLGYRVGLTTIVRTLSGSKDKRLLEQQLHTLSTYGLMRNVARNQIRKIAEQLEVEGYLRTEPEHQTIVLTPGAAEILYREKQVSMLVRKEAQQSCVDATEAEESELYEILRQTRAQLARENGIPAYHVFSNATLQDMAKKCPRTVTEFKRVSGVGELKANWYGKPFLQAIREYLEQGS